MIENDVKEVLKNIDSNLKSLGLLYSHYDIINSSYETKDNISDKQSNICYDFRFFYNDGLKFYDLFNFFYKYDVVKDITYSQSIVKISFFTDIKDIRKSKLQKLKL